MKSPYQGRPPESFWKSGVAEKTVATLKSIYRPKFRIKKDEKVVTLGSCFAQHIARNMLERGYTVVDTEPSPPGLNGSEAGRFGYGLFSARVGNIYVMRQLLQLYEEAHGFWSPAQSVWEKDGRFYDAMRPSVEPDGFDSPEGVLIHRRKHLVALKRMFAEADVIIFTLGLTECWMHTESGDVYPTAPGTVAGSYDESEYEFKNFTASEIYDDFVKLMSYLTNSNPKLKILLTVSPVPLTATATAEHVLVATTYSKAVLRAVAGQLSSEFDCVDYFPSYDIITSTLSSGKFYQPNLRSVTPEGVAIVMDTFFAASGDDRSGCAATGKVVRSYDAGCLEDEFCEDVLLEAFDR